MKDNYTGYNWIKVKRFKPDTNKTWEQRYQDLEAHHVEETQFLINKVRELAAQLAGGPDMHKKVDEAKRLPSECCYG